MLFHSYWISWSNPAQERKPCMFRSSARKGRAHNYIFRATCTLVSKSRRSCSLGSSAPHESTLHHGAIIKGYCVVEKYGQLNLPLISSCAILLWSAFLGTPLNLLNASGFARSRRGFFSVFHLNSVVCHMSSFQTHIFHIKCIALKWEVIWAHETASTESDLSLTQHRNHNWQCGSSKSCANISPIPPASENTDLQNWGSENIFSRINLYEFGMLIPKLHQFSLSHLVPEIRHSLVMVQTASSCESNGIVFLMRKLFDLFTNKIMPYLQY